MHTLELFALLCFSPLCLLAMDASTPVPPAASAAAKVSYYCHDAQLNDDGSVVPIAPEETPSTSIIVIAPYQELAPDGAHLPSAKYQHLWLNETVLALVTSDAFKTIPSTTRATSLGLTVDLSIIHQKTFLCSYFTSRVSKKSTSYGCNEIAAALDKVFRPNIATKTPAPPPPAPPSAFSTPSPAVSRRTALSSTRSAGSGHNDGPLSFWNVPCAAPAGVSEEIAALIENAPTFLAIDHEGTVRNLVDRLTTCPPGSADYAALNGFLVENGVTVEPPSRTKEISVFPVGNYPDIGSSLPAPFASAPVAADDSIDTVDAHTCIEIIANMTNSVLPDETALRKIQAFNSMLQDTALLALKQTAKLAITNLDTLKHAAALEVLYWGSIKVLLGLQEFGHISADDPFVLTCMELQKLHRMFSQKAGK